MSISVVPTLSDNPSPAELSAQVRYLSDRMAIQDLMIRMHRGADRFDSELFQSCFHEDAIIDTGGYCTDAMEVYDGGCVQHERDQSVSLHNILNHTCDIDGDVAHGETGMLFQGINRDGTVMTAAGRYINRFERRDGEWKIALQYTLVELAMKVPGMAAPGYEQIPDIHANGVPSRGKEDPSYRRPFVNVRAARTKTNTGS